MTCYDCDGRGWMYLDEFLEKEGDELLGEPPPRYYLRNFGEPFEIGICPDCDGTGIEQDEDYAENLEIMKIIDNYMNYRGFGWAYLLDVKERKACKVFYFQWRTHRWNLLTLSATVPGLFEDSE